MNLAPVTELLRQRIGLDPESLGPTTLVRAVAARMEVLGLTEAAAYAARLAGDAQEFRALAEDMAVPETWFFRGGEVFAHLARRAAEAVRRRTAGSKFRVLSIPCSTGEEPYSLAIALVEAGVAPAAWEIDAVDLSVRHLELARQARFTDFSFRQTAPDLRLRHFRQVDGRWELSPDLRSRVRFRQGNLLDPHFLAGEPPFDLVFCRNLFIYLHAAARQQALDTLARLLALNGYLCMGHAEPLEFQDRRFTRDGPGELFLYRRTAESKSRETSGTDPSSASRSNFVGQVADLPAAQPGRWPAPRNEGGTNPSARARPAGPVLTAPARPGKLSPPPAPPPTLPVNDRPRPVDLLAQARQEADAGKLSEALATCQAQLARSGPSADLLSLQGVIYQARGERAQAVRSYQQALYLEPRHADALTHLLLLFREQGNDVQAERLQRRLERLAPEGTP